MRIYPTFFWNRLWLISIYSVEDILPIYDANAEMLVVLNTFYFAELSLKMNKASAQGVNTKWALHML